MRISGLSSFPFCVAPAALPTDQIAHIFQKWDIFPQIRFLMNWKIVPNQNMKTTNNQLKDRIMIYCNIRLNFQVEAACLYCVLGFTFEFYVPFSFYSSSMIIFSIAGWRGCWSSCRGRRLSCQKEVFREMEICRNGNLLICRFQPWPRLSKLVAFKLS